MRIIYTIFMLIMGTIFGSFYNVVGYRIPNGLSIVKPGSFCPKCNHSLKWYELIPVFSYLFQQGKCRNCKERISIIYPMVEITTGILFAVSYYVFGFSYELILALIVSSFLVIVIVSDINYLIIPDEVTFFFCLLLFLIRLIIDGFEASIFTLGYGLILFGIMYLIMILGNWFFKKESMGGGDVKLMFFVGMATGPILGIFSIFLSSVIALPLSLMVYLKDRDNVIPFGPFILIATFIIILFGIDSNMILGIFQ